MSRSRTRVTLALARAVLGAACGLAGSAAAAAPASSQSPATPTGKVSLPTVITAFSASIDQYGRVTYSGCLGLRSGIPAPLAPRPPAPVIQYEAQPSGPWQTLGTAAVAKVACGNRGEKFSGTLPAKLNLAYYRARFGGSSGTPAPATRYLAAASQPVLAWKFATVSPMVYVNVR